MHLARCFPYDPAHAHNRPGGGDPQPRCVDKDTRHRDVTGWREITLLGGGKVNAAVLEPHPTPPHCTPQAAQPGQRVTAQLVPAGSEPDLNTTHGERGRPLETTVKFQIIAAERGEEKKQKWSNYVYPLLILSSEKLVFALYNGGMN